MLKKLKLENFMRHEDLEVELKPGLQCIRGSNESGKSSVINAVAYALFGSRALRTNFDDAVTWGVDPKKLKVTLTIAFDNKDYVFSRSKSGAEVMVDGKVFVTGQTEVSNFAASMLGADINMAAKLMFANQNNVRAALDGGPRELSAIVENLAGMDIFDRILESAQEKLALGSPALIEERLKGAESTLEAAATNAPEKPVDVGPSVAALQSERAALETSLPTLRASAAAALEAHEKATSLYMQKRDLKRALYDAAKRLDESEAEVMRLNAVVADEPDTRELDNLRAQVAFADSYEANVKAWELFNNLPTGVRFAGNQDAFEADVARMAGKRKEVTAEIDVVNRQMIELKHKRINADTCDKCGQSITHLAHVKETNAQVDEMIAQLAPRLMELDGEFAAIRQYEDSVATLRKFARSIEANVRPLGAYVKWDQNQYPELPTWVGPPISSEKPVAPRDALLKVERVVAAWEQNKVKLEYASEQHAMIKSVFASSTKAVDAFAAPDEDEVLALSATSREKSNAVVHAEGRAATIESEITGLQSEYDSALKLWQMSSDRIKDAESVIAKCKDDLDNLGFNNALIKKLRAIRPLVADKIWNTVLASTSVMFSQIRGDQSVITKDKEGFRCNGQAIESLSGSTLDALALALRVALIRTFVPQCGLLVLDEPFASMDENRTTSSLGFIQTVDMGQTLLITHEVISEQFSNNVIDIGGV